MQLTLDMVRNSLRKALGQDSFIATFIKSVTPNPTCVTAAIDVEGNLQYTPQFLEKFAHTRQALFCLIVHELMHRMFGHFIYQSGPLENVAADAVINACITHGFPSASADGILFKDLYKPTGIEGLLRPESQMSSSRYCSLYWVLYKNGGSRGGKLSTGEVINALKILAPQEQMEKVLLLGGHGKLRNEDGLPEQFPSQLLSDIAYDLRRSVKAGSGGNGAGHSDLIQELLIQILNSNISLKRTILEKFAAKQKLENFISTTQSPRLSRSPIPLHPSKRELVLLSAGIYPFHYRRQSMEMKEVKKGLAIYLDVSGSVNEHLPKIVGMLQGLRQELKTIFLFSNKVVEVPMKTLLAGRVKTTYGTDFNCIALSILQRKIEKAIVITDGYAHLFDHLAKDLIDKKVSMMTVLFGASHVCPELAKVGDVVRLEEVSN